MEQNNLAFVILCGIPCSGKSTWAAQVASKYILEKGTPVAIICKDDIRENLFGKDYTYSNENEKKVIDEYYKQLGRASAFKNALVILDNTHCKPSNIDSYFSIFKGMYSTGHVKIYVKFFDIPLWKAYVRNVLRKWKTGKYIPKKAIKGMHKAYKAIDQSKYKDLIFSEL
jgi:predicted kinase